MNLDTRWLEDFLALADIKHFSKAATARHITQPAFGRRIRSLENAVGQPLFDRSTTPITLTLAGRQFHNVARNIVEQMYLGLTQLDQLDSPQQQPVRIASPHSLTSPSLIDLITLLEQDADPIPYSVDVMRVDEGIDALKEGRYDFFLGFEHLALLQPPFNNLLLGHGHFFLVTAADNNGEPIYSLNSSPLPLQTYSSESYTARLIEQHRPTVSTTNNPIFESSMCQLHKELVLRKKGIAWLPDCMIQSELSNGTLLPIEPKSLRIPYQIRLYRHATPLQTHAEALWDDLTQRCASGWQFITSV
ncbi:LysR substrate-binding domain-containing protein [Thaumasiovibrio sp. DFM-14]|uniref:LysR substrate-binding domain-containing protein n=1 Tax=Thaumasiovibrio sp. DFM-14 TaxID=3384792 RepID=UPI0039A2855F